MDSCSLAFVISVVFIAIVFEFINGFHDAANAIATVVSTRVLKPHHAVMCGVFLSARPTRLQGLSWESVPQGGSRSSAGAWREKSFGPGF